MRQKSLLAVAVCATALAGLSSPAFAGEVKGPPRSGGEDTQGPSHARSACVFNGLNDLVEGEGQTDFIVQSYGIDVSGMTSDSADPHVFNPGNVEACRGVPPEH
jgi:hypothetical protein